MGMDPAILPAHFLSNRDVRPELDSSVKRNARTTLPAPNARLNPIVRRRWAARAREARRNAREQEAGWSNRQRCEERCRLRFRKNRRGGNRLAMPGSENRNDAKMGGGGIRMQPLMQRGRGTQRSREHDGQSENRSKTAMAERIESFVSTGCHCEWSFPHCFVNGKRRSLGGRWYRCRVTSDRSIRSG